ncbi:ABC transporter permease subunit [Azospirillum sp. TSO22-1]|uniref:ABC transporter permease n=1 Tax=Azospirillum sp. TSO22-1 TaxID=716789 RepID=UPI000D6168B3|nr:ABC transporter permease subunit [Azospirillum sp. TSO22-1]PWC40384.1 ABC transporter permease [Azospirillum sp. TSO22-1]
MSVASTRSEVRPAVLFEALSLWPGVLAAGVAWEATAALTLLWPDLEEWVHTGTLAVLQAVLGAAFIVAAVAGPYLGGAVARLRPAAPWLIALAGLAALWQALTAKLMWLPLPFFAPPQALLEAYIDDWARLIDCTVNSVGLLVTGYLVGAFTGFLVGVALGWSRTAAYWGHPVLRLIGPMPATAWLPVAFFAFPSSWSASVFLIALASGTPVAVLTWSGVSAVNSAYYDIARTLGANQRFLVRKVAIPAAMPHVFVGLFMGLCSSFAVLVVAEMLGVKSGLGWYLQWAQGWAAYANMYAALVVMALVCSGLVLLLFLARDRLLAWQKGLVRW